MPAPDPTPFHVRVRTEKREAALERLGYGSYDTYLGSPAWRATKFRYIEERPWICHICGTTENLQLHHRTYERVGEEELDDLMPLCDPCHGLVHSLERQGRVRLDFEGVIDETRAAAGRAQLVAQADAVAQELEETQRQARERIEALPFDVRLRYALNHAKVQRIDVRSQKRMLARHMAQGVSREVLLRRLASVERVAYRHGYPIRL
jgi:hypothetical protein